MTSVMRREDPHPATPDIQGLAKTNFAKASVQMMLNKDTAFYSAMLMEMQIVWTDSIVAIAGVDMYNRLYMNYSAFASMDVPRAIFVLVHELEHVIRLHPHRVAQRDPYQWNVAGDMVINADLRKYRIGTFLEGGIDTPEHAGRLTETVYNELPPPPPQPQGGSGGDSGEGDGDGDGDGTGSDPRGDIGGTGSDVIQGDPLGDQEGEGKGGKPLTAEERRQLEASTKGMLAKAVQTARVAGNLSAEMERRIEDVLDVKTPWYEILERCMTEKASTDYSWMTPNRRYASLGITLPSLADVGSLGTTAIIRDVSGSCDREQKPFIGHMNNIMERCKPTDLWVLDTSTEVHEPRHFTADELPINPDIMGGGGTHLVAGFDWLRDNTNTDELACVIVLTDGYTAWPDYQFDCPVFILCTTDIDVEYGDETIRFDIDES